MATRKKPILDDVRNQVFGLTDSVSRLARRIRRSGVFKDRLEYDVEDLMKAYGLSQDDAATLRRELHLMAGEP